MAARSIHALLFVLASAAGCEDRPRPAPIVDASVSASAQAEPPAPPREGCARVGILDGIEAEASCVVGRANEDVMRATLKDLSITLTPEPSEVVGGGMALLNLAIKNVGSSEVTLYLEARARPAGPRTDWSRVAGVPEPHPIASEVPRLLFPLTTTDSRDHDVDAVPTIAGSTPVPPPPTLLAVHLRPGGKVTRAIAWWALRIPAPAKPVTNDAGHRYVPKTTAISLVPGEYNVTVELPFHGLSREERTIATRMRVARIPLPDGGLRRYY